MNTEHFCQEHNCEFKQYTKGDKSWYSHKQGDVWCNEVKKSPKAFTSPVPAHAGEVLPQETNPVTRETPRAEKKEGNEYWEKKQSIERASIEQQVAVKAIVEMVGKGILDGADPLTQAARNWCSSALQNWCSMGTVDTSHPITGDKPSETDATSTEVAVLYGLIKNTLRLKTNEAVDSWLGNVAKVSLEQVKKEPKVVSQELIKKFNWK